MFAPIYQALLRFFGFGPVAAKNPPPPSTIEYPPMFSMWLNRAAQMRANPAITAPMNFAEAVDVFASDHGQRPANQAPPSAERVRIAEDRIGNGILQYLMLLIMLGRALPKMAANGDVDAFEFHVAELSLSDVKTWLDGLYSEKPIRMPPTITEVLVHRTARALGQQQPQRMLYDDELPFAYAETQMHVVEIRTGFCVFPRVIVRGENPIVEFPWSVKRFHKESAILSGWEFRMGWAGPVFEPPVIDDEGVEAGQAADELIPKSSKK